MAKTVMKQKNWPMIWENLRNNKKIMTVPLIQISQKSMLLIKNSKTTKTDLTRLKKH